QVFDDERQDLAIFSTKAVCLPQTSNFIVWRDELSADPNQLCWVVAIFFHQKQVNVQGFFILCNFVFVQLCFGVTLFLCNLA
ncbi:MAG: hypothetical protein Q4G13_01965, partial [Moraxella sp.]|nr:hypothetical protein [Moraxella sp.]